MPELGSHRGPRWDGALALYWRRLSNIKISVPLRFIGANANMGAGYAVSATTSISARAGFHRNHPVDGLSDFCTLPMTA